MLVYPREYRVLPGAHLLVCWLSPKQVWSQHLAACEPSCFLSVNVTWRSSVRARGSGCRSFDSSLCFFSVKCGSSVSARFLIYGAHAVSADKSSSWILLVPFSAFQSLTLNHFFSPFLSPFPTHTFHPTSTTTSP
jgi:hypothetical protein